MLSVCCFVVLLIFVVILLFCFWIWDCVIIDLSSVRTPVLKYVGYYAELPLNLPKEIETSIVAGMQEESCSQSKSCSYSYDRGVGR